MSEILVEPVKTILEKACEAASSMLRYADVYGTDYRIELIEHEEDDIIALYLKFNDEVVYKKMWKAIDSSHLDERAVMYGSFLTELIATYCLVVQGHKKGVSNK